ncbi:MAG: molybdopterin-dependent oxidoreductase [Spirochaetales bacterium]|nr:molybdopterin-dependent oxidoreductase [Spirochaetales bacterium]
MKRTLTRILFLTASIALLWTGCVSAPSGGENTEALPDWSVSLSGIRQDTLTASYFQDAKEHGSHYVERVYERKGETNTYKGMPLWLICAMVDGPDGKHPYIFDEDLWKQGYDVTIVAADGYSATFNTVDLPPDAMILADSVDGEPVSPRIAGDIPGNLWVKDVVALELALGSGGETEIFTLEMDINGEGFSYTLEDLEASPYYLEDMGSYTTSAGTTYTHRYGGVRFADLLSSYVKIEDDTTITVQAMDGYEMTYNGAQITDTSDGVWILAFKADGEYLPLDPGYIRTVKVGPGTPNIEGHSSARMVKKILVSAEPYRDFNLTMEGLINDVLDRQTVQAGISCHKTEVQYYNKKSDEVIAYQGIPLWCLMAWSDDPDYAPHKQDKSILSYNAEAAEAGYSVVITASDGFSVTLDSRELHKNDQVILAMYREGKELAGDEWPLILVWDKDTAVVPQGIKAVKNVAKISLIIE